MTRLADPLRSVLGGRTAQPLADAFGLVTVADLLRHYPRRYAQRGELTDLATLAEDQEVTVLAEVRSVTSRPMRGRRGTILEARVTDGTGDLILTFFNQAWRGKQLRPGRRGLFAGKVGTYRGQRQLAHPDFVLFGEGDDDADEQADEFLRDLVPVYPATAKLRSWTIFRCARLALEHLAVEPADDPVPPDVAAAEGLVPLADALRMIHLPESQHEARRAQERLRFDEAWQVQLVLAQRRADLAGQPAVPRPPVSGGIVDGFAQRLPFELTAGQRDVVEELSADLAQAHPMNRLLQGEVGSGKTAVALHAMLQVVANGGQAALLAPTEVLAEQHLRSIRSLLGPLAEGGLLGGDSQGTQVALLTGSQPAAARRANLLAAVTGEAGIVVGTHALLSDPVGFHDLGLVVVDEQHRFGVEQRAALATKARDGTRPHLLVMTATPIPRTVAMTVFGDLAVSTLRELPAGRQPIATHVVPALERPGYVTRMWERIVEEVGSGRQAYIVCPRIDPGDAPAADGEGDWSSASSVVELAAQLQQGPLQSVRVAALHGRMPADEKDDVMRRFAEPTASDGVDVLIATTVVEVGVDVPNATVMAIMDADRFGVSQLHQLRGRVGRGGHPGLCLLHTMAPPDTPARERLAAVAGTLDGFELSRLDLQQRREGDVLGSAQSGRRSSLHLLSALRDEEVIRAARRRAGDLLREDPGLTAHPGAAAALEQWRADERLDYAEKS